MFIDRTILDDIRYNIMNFDRIYVSPWDRIKHLITYCNLLLTDHKDKLNEVHSVATDKISLYKSLFEYPHPRYSFYLLYMQRCQQNLGYIWYIYCAEKENNNGIIKHSQDSFCVFIKKFIEYLDLCIFEFEGYAARQAP